jgi:hypothetical protein
MALTPISSITVEEEPQLLEPTTLYFLGGQLTTMGVPVIAHVIAFSVRPAGKRGEIVHLVRAARGPARLVTWVEKEVVARTIMNGASAYLIRGHTAITRTTTVVDVEPPLFFAVTV